MEYSVDINTENSCDYYAETLYHFEAMLCRIISTAVMQGDKLVAFEFNPENI
jgi:hypothetical protein